MAHQEPSPAQTEQATLPLNLADIQGIILCEYDLPLVRHFLLRIDSAEGGRRFIGELVKDNPSPLRITTTKDWLEGKRSDYCLNISLTYEGLQALHLPTSSLESFAPAKAFVNGAAARAAELGDVDTSAPPHWKGALGTSAVHILVSLYVEQGRLADRTFSLRALFQQYELTELQYEDGAFLTDPNNQGNNLPGMLIHFGYRDGISQPKIKGAPVPQYAAPNVLEVEPGAFLLGYRSQWSNFIYPAPYPPELGRNGSFVAFRILQQDVAAFEEYLTKAAQATDMDRETIAAKMCGRWRNGTPLVLSPTTPSPQPALPPGRLNDFDFIEDREGYACPFNAHIRRTNPRGEGVAGADSDKHPLIRRGMPYGPRYNPDLGKDDDTERGLLGLFICVSLEDQFEFLITNWMNRGGFRPELPSQAKDPIAGGGTIQGMPFQIPAPNGTVSLPDFSHFVTTRGAAYCFLPSITALRYIANL